MAARQSISGWECVEALQRVGFEVRTRTEGIVILQRGYRMLFVPEVPVVSPEQLNAVLSAAGVTYMAFEELLTTPGSLRSGLYPKLTENADD